MNQTRHPLEYNEAEREYAARAAATSTQGIAGYRRAVLACTGSLPSWLARKRPGRKPGAAKAAAVPDKA
ncbi:hypothetical protein [Cupriavidus sp. IDO]|uniref:hypothetical protein n=1 Tax=Cupriavidus sp. IDO TaxID=1539142 RepID=UPI000579343D|nr:hypothetical protein [Cupriavidus sp. IDO]KWR90377.1 hypothetical protein RM96_10165 [Cupriavidus sp. IDO]